MKKPILVYIVFLTFGFFQMSENTVAAQASPKIDTVVLTDSILNTKIDSSKSVLSLQNRLDSIKKTLRLNGENMAGQTSPDVPWWLLILTFLNTFGVVYLFVSKKKNGRSTLQSGASSSERNVAADNNAKTYHREKTGISQNHNHATNKAASSTACSDEAKSCNVVVTTHVKRESSVRTQPIKKQEKRKAKLHRFTNFMIDNGRISTQERTITDESTDKLFAIDYEEGANVATYTINPESKASILSDIQTFQNYVEKFSIIGPPTDVEVKKVGFLKKVGSLWVVTEKLIVEFK